MDRKAIGSRLKELISGSMINTKVLGEQLGVHYDTIMKWFKGKTIPSHETLIDLSEILNVSVDYILKGEKIQRHPNFDIDNSATKLLSEQVDFYKEKADFFERRFEGLKREILSGKRKGDPEDLDVKKIRKVL